MDIIDLKARFKKWLFMPSYEIVDVVLGCVAANMIPGDCVSIYLVGAPGTGKTELLRATEGYHGVQAVSKITPNTFTSGYGGKKAVGLLSKMKNRRKNIIVMKDFTSILSMRAEARAEIIGQIREIADGKYDAFWGNDEEEAWVGKLAVIAGVTNIIDDYTGVLQSLGERFLYYRLRAGDPLETAGFSQSNLGLEEIMRKELSVGIKNFFEDLPFRGKVEQSGSIKEKILNLACWVAAARSIVKRDKFTGIHTYEPQPEGPSRLTKQLSQLAAGIAIVNGKDEIDEDTYNIIRKVGIDTVSGIRYRILRWMMDNGLMNGRCASTQDICSGCSLTTTTARHYLEDFEMMGVADKQVILGGNFSWKLKDSFVGYTQKARIV